MLAGVLDKNRNPKLNIFTSFICRYFLSKLPQNRTTKPSIKLIRTKKKDFMSTRNKVYFFKKFILNLFYFISFFFIRFAIK